MDDRMIAAAAADVVASSAVEDRKMGAVRTA